MSEYIITDKMREWGKANGYNVDIHAEFFNDYLINKIGKPYRDLDAAFRNCVRSDWGGLRRSQKQKGQQNGTGFISERDKARKRVAKELCGYDQDAINGVSSRVD